MFGVAKAHRSIAVEADAKHLITDVWTSAGVVVGLIGIALTGWLWLDALTAIGVALNILREGAHLMWRSSQGLMDEALEPELLKRMEEVLSHFDQQAIRFDHVITRRSGQRRFVDLHMHMPGSWTLAQAATLRSEVEQALIRAIPGLHPTIQMLPVGVEAHFDDLSQSSEAGL
jgi:cation diffusion facilitator family transporter